MLVYVSILAMLCWKILFNGAPDQIRGIHNVIDHWASNLFGLQLSVNLFLLFSPPPAWGGGRFSQFENLCDIYTGVLPCMRQSSHVAKLWLGGVPPLLTRSLWGRTNKHTKLSKVLFSCSVGTNLDSNSPAITWHLTSKMTRRFPACSQTCFNRINLWVFFSRVFVAL